MKAVILERRGDEAVVLCEDGSFVKTRREGEIGETIELSAETIAFPTKNRRKRWLRSAVAAVLVLALTGGTLGYMGGTASAYVSLDVEDSAIELTVNHFGRVIAVDALNDDATEFAKHLSGKVRHHRADDALDITMEQMRGRGYLDDGETAVIAGVTADDARRAEELKGFVEHSAGHGGERPVYISEMSRAEREQARGQHMSPGRFGYARDHGGMQGPPPGQRDEAGAPVPPPPPSQTPQEAARPEGAEPSASPKPMT